MLPRKKPEEKIVGNALSKKRNQGTQRIIKQIIAHQKVTSFKVRVEFIPTWERGRKYFWRSSNWNEEVEVYDDDEPEQEEETELVEPLEPGGVEEEMVRKPRTRVSAPTETKKPEMVCVKCFSSKGSSLDPYPQGKWVHCGYEGCKDFNVHASCISLYLQMSMTKKDLLQYCQQYIRCPQHVGRVKPSGQSVFDEACDNPFEYGSQASKSSSQVPVLSSQVPELTSQDPDFTSQDPDFTSQDPDFTSQDPDFTSKFPEFSLQFPQLYHDEAGDTPSARKRKLLKPLIRGPNKRIKTVNSYDQYKTGTEKFSLGWSCDGPDDQNGSKKPHKNNTKKSRPVLSSKAKHLFAAMKNGPELNPEPSSSSTAEDQDQSSLKTASSPNTQKMLKQLKSVVPKSNQSNRHEKRRSKGLFLISDDEFD